MATEKPQFKLIDGGGERLSGWLSPPQTAVGRSPFDRSAISAYRVSVGDLKKHLNGGRRQPIMDLWWHVYGELPPIPGIERYNHLVAPGKAGLHSAHACFRGLMRPVAEDDRGSDYVAFVTKPKVGFRYKPSMSCLAEPFEIPRDLVFVTYARLDFPEGRAYQSRNGNLPIANGIITHWQLVECDPDDLQLPVDHGVRFRRRYW